MELPPLFRTLATSTLLYDVLNIAVSQLVARSGRRAPDFPLNLQET
jgi:hypothetical protein